MLEKTVGVLILASYNTGVDQFVGLYTKVKKRIQNINYQHIWMKLSV